MINRNNIKRLLMLLIMVFIAIFLNTIVFAANTGFSKDSSGYLTYNDNRIELSTYNGTGFLDLVANGDSQKRGEFINTPVRDLMNSKMRSVNGNYLRYRRSLCVNHQQADQNAEGYYYINNVLDFYYNNQGQMVCKLYYNKGSELKNVILKDYAKELNAMIYINGKYQRDSVQYKNETNQVWRIFAEKNKKYISNTFYNTYKEGIWQSSLLSEEAKEEYYDILDKYNNFKILEKKSIYDDAGNEVLPKEDMLDGISKENYRIVGPFNMNFNQENYIEKILVNGHTLSQCYWIYEGDNGTHWNTNLSDIQPNKNLYLAIHKDFLPEVNVDYDITFCQKKMEYYKSRIVLLATDYKQQLGTFVENDTPDQVGGEVKYTISHTENRKLRIEKYDYETEEPIEGVELKVYAKLANNSGEGWVIEGNNLTQDPESATTFRTNAQGKVELINLSKGIYYVYETRAGDGYDLEVQRNKYRFQTDVLGFSQSLGYVYLGNTDNGQNLNWTNYLMIKYQYQETQFTIEKIDRIDKSIKLKGVKLKIYKKTDGGESGWLKEDLSLTDSFEAAKSWETGTDRNCKYQEFKSRRLLCI